MNLEANCDYGRPWMKQSFINQGKTTVSEEDSVGGPMMTKINKKSRDDVIG